MILLKPPISQANNEIINSQIEDTGISSFLNESEKYVSNTFPDMNITDVFNTSVSGNLEVSGIWGWIINLLGDELETAIKSVVTILIIIIIHSVLKSIIENLGNDGVSKIAYFIQYLIIVGLIVNTFTDMLEIVEDAIVNISNFMNLLIPILITLMMTSGSIVSSGIAETVLLFAINIMSNLISKFIIPLILVATTLSIVSNFSDKVHVDRLSKFIKSAVIWILGVILTIFVCLLSIEGTLGQSVDGLTSKTAKAAVSTFIPVVGKVIGDSVETVIGCANILKNAVGAIGLVVILGIVAVPIIKVTIMWALIKILSALCEIIADEKVVKLLDAIGDSYKTLFGILVSVSVMFIVGITIVLRMTSG